MLEFGTVSIEWKTIIIQLLLLIIPFLIILLSLIGLVKTIRAKHHSHSDKLLELERRIEQLEKKLE